MITRERFGYLPGSMDLAYLSQDLEQLNAAVESGTVECSVLLETSSECEAEAKRLGIQDVVAQTLVMRSRVLLGNQRYSEAISVLREAERELGDLRQHDLKVRVYAGLADAYAARGEWRDVSEICEMGIGIVEPRRYDVSGQYLQSAYLRSRIGLYSRGVQAAYATGQYRLMLERAELSKCRSVLRQRTDAANSRPEATQTAREFRAVCAQIDSARAKNFNGAKLAQLLSKRRTLWDLLLIERGQAELPEFDLDRIKALLEPDEAVLYYYWLNRTTLLIALIDQSEVVASVRTIDLEQRSALDRFCQDILGRLNIDLPGFQTYLDRLVDFAPALIPEEIAGRLGRVQRLLISPHLVLHAFPFHALPWDVDNPYLIQRFAVTYIPNLRSLMVAYDTPSKHSLLALGICDYRIAGREPDRLPEVEVEVRDLEHLTKQHGIDSLCLIGPQASRNNLMNLERKGKLGTFTRLHIATHGHNVDSDTPMESYLLLYDSLLEGLEIADWQLGAELVVLSACSSGQRSIDGRGMPELPGDDLFGLQAAFFAAGAKRVIGSLWPVGSTAAREIMTALHRYLLEAQTPERALRSAILEYLQTARLLTRKRFHWAAFFLSALGRPTAQVDGCP